MMKTLLSLVASLLALPAHAAVQVLACEPEWAALATEIGGKLVAAESATTPQQDPHYIQARPSLISKVRRAQLIVCTGADLEVGWLPLLLRQGGNAAVQPGQPGFLNAADFVELLEKPSSVDRSLGDIHPYGNPHIQTDPRNIAKVAAALADRLAMLDGANAATYKQRYEDFSQRWQAAVERWTTAVAPLKGKKVVTHHKAGCISRTGPASSRSATSSRSPVCRRAPRISPSYSISSRASKFRGSCARPTRTRRRRSGSAAAR